MPGKFGFFEEYKWNTTVSTNKTTTTSYGTKKATTTTWNTTDSTTTIYDTKKSTDTIFTTETKGFDIKKDLQSKEGFRHC